MESSYFNEMYFIDIFVIIILQKKNNFPVTVRD